MDLSSTIGVTPQICGCPMMIVSLDSLTVTNLRLLSQPSKKTKRLKKEAAEFRLPHPVTVTQANLF